MSGLFTARVSASEIAAQFGVDDAPTLPIPPYVVEGNSSVVVLEDNGRRLLKPMTWGFPRLTREARLPTSSTQPMPCAGTASRSRLS